MKQLMKKQGVISTYKKVMNKLELPSPLGYNSADKVIDVANDVDEFKVGDRVACAGSGHVEIVSVRKNLCVKIPNDMKNRTCCIYNNWFNCITGSETI